jgi:hypothetical protein
MGLPLSQNFTNYHTDFTFRAFGHIFFLKIKNLGMFALRANNFNRQGFLFHNNTLYGIGITINQAFKFGSSPI